MIPTRFTSSAAKSGTIKAKQSDLRFEPIPSRQTIRNGGLKVATRFVVFFDGRDRRCYTCDSNPKQMFIETKTKRINIEVSQ